MKRFIVICFWVFIAANFRSVRASEEAIPAPEGKAGDAAKKEMNPVQRLLYAILNINLGPFPVNSVTKAVFKVPILRELFTYPLAFLNPYIGE